MKTINTRGLNDAAIGLSQSFHAGLNSTHIAPTENSTPRMFTSTLAGSFTGEVLVTLGEGAMSSENHAKILMQYAFDQGRPVSEVAREYTQLLGQLGRSTMIFREIIATIIGINDRSVATNRVAVTTPTMIFAELENILKRAKVDAPALYIHLMTDFICHTLRPFSWVIPDNGYTYRLRRPSVFPRYSDIADILATQDLARVLDSMARADLSAVKKMLDAKKAVSPAQISTHLTTALLQAYDLSKTSYDPHAMAASVLTVLYRLWDPSTPELIRPSGRIQKNEVINKLQSNFGLFLAAQNMAKVAPEAMELSYEDEEFTSVILPLFDRALSESATFKLRILGDVVDFLGKRTAYDGYSAPATTVLYEGFDVKGTMEAFVPVRHLRQTDSRYLVPQSEVSAALNNVLNPISAYMEVSDIVDQRLRAHELAASERKGHDGGVNLVLAFPSLIEREVSMGVRPKVLRTFISTNTYPDTVVAEGEDLAVRTAVERSVLDSLRYDYYALIMHLAVSRPDGMIVSVTPVKGAGVSNIAISWEARTTYKHPLGDSAILHGIVTTTEPIEALVYASDFANSAQLKTHLVDLEHNERNVHIWEWWNASRKLDFIAGYEATIGNKSHIVEVRDFELLGLGVHRDNLWYLLPRNVAAMVRLWSESIFEEDDFIKTHSSKIKDPLLRQAYVGLRLQSGLQLVRTLATIGSTGVGGRISSLVRRRLAEAMYKDGEVDNASQLVVGIQAARLSVWSGLTTLSLLGLLSREEVTELFRIIRDTQAMAMFVNASNA